MLIILTRFPSCNTSIFNTDITTMTKYAVILYGVLFLNVVALAARSRSFKIGSIEDNGSGKSGSSQHLTTMALRHRQLLYRIYLPVYLLAACADWLQGPYKYAVYSAYGYDQRAISILFVAGFGSGMTLGSVVGGLADSWGRKKMACAYCVAYTFSCLAKHFRPFWVLLLGRVLGGMATSLLFSVFDSWLIRAASDRNIDKSFLSESFSAANFGSSVVAILSGFIANAVVGKEPESNLRPFFTLANQKWLREESELGVSGPPLTVEDPRWNAAWVYTGGGIAAFDLALVPLALCFLLATVFWEENYGNEDLGRDLPTTAIAEEESTKKGHKIWGMFSGLRGAFITVWRSSGIFNLCAITSLFEGAMYVFILLWTPALRALDKHPEDVDYPGPPLGIVFATFMVACMLGTSIFAILSNRGIRPSRILVFVLALAAVSCMTIAYTPDDTTSYIAMLVFEGCIGVYYPAMSTMKGGIVPEDQRAAIYSVFRLPLNVVVLLNLLSQFGFQKSFGICTLMLALATTLQLRVVRWEEVGASSLLRGHHNGEMTTLLKTKDSNVMDTDC